MSTCQEISLFPLTETEIMRMELNKMKKEVSNLRRGLFARHDSLLQMYNETKDELERLRSTLETEKQTEKPKCEMIFV